MNQPWVYMCFPSHPSGSSQCTSPEHPASCIEPGLAIRFLYDIIHIMRFSQIIQLWSHSLFLFLGWLLIETTAEHPCLIATFFMKKWKELMEQEINKRRKEIHKTLRLFSPSGEKKKIIYLEYFASRGYINMDL